MGRTAIQILDDMEQEWAPRLRAVSLTAELQVPEKRVRLATKCLGMLYGGRPHRMNNYPATMVVALSGVGALEYDAGTYWSSVWELAGIRADQTTATEWGQLFLRGLDRFRCPIF